MIRCPYRLIAGATCVPEATRSRAGQQTNYPHIGLCAQALGVSRTHLWYVLEGERIGRPGLICAFWQESERITDEKKGGGK